MCFLDSNGKDQCRIVQENIFIWYWHVNVSFLQITVFSLDELPFFQAQDSGTSPLVKAELLV